MYNIMETAKLFILVIIVILLIIVISYMLQDIHTLTGLTEATTVQQIDATNLDTSNPNSSNFTYSIWFYIDDWSYKYGKSKVIFGRMRQEMEGNVNTNQPCPSVSLGDTQNNIEVSLTVYPTYDNVSNNSENFIVNTFSIANISIQKWVNLLASVYGRTMDIYIDGKLVRTCLLDGVAKIDTTAPVYITPYGGFSGWTAKFQYWSHETDPQTAWNIYNQGYGGSLLGNLFGKYTVKVSLMEGDTEDSSIVI
jgi:hypothetical protein